VPIALALGGGGLILALLTVGVGVGLVSNVVGQLAGAFTSAVGRISSPAVATGNPSAVAIDTPVLDTPDNGGYTNITPTILQGSVPGTAVAKPDYVVIVYRVGEDGQRSAVARVTVGGTTRFSTPMVSLSEGDNVFVAAIQTPAGEGQISPSVDWILDTTPPAIKIISPLANAQLSASAVDVTGVTDAGATVTIRNEQAPGGAPGNQVVGADGRFNLTVPVVAGSNTIDLTATDRAGNSADTSVTVTRDYGQLAAHLSVSPSKFPVTSPTSVTLTVHATSVNGGPLANANVTFTVSIDGLGPIVSPELTTDATGTATWQVTISGGVPGPGQANVLITSPAGDQVTGSAPITTT